jgi:hypothetical protein
MQKTLAECHVTTLSQTTPQLPHVRYFLQTIDTSADTHHGTRSKNKNEHPGAIEIATKRKRRTKEQIAADNAAKEAKKQEKGRKMHKQIKNVASLEGEMAEKDANADGAHPRSRNGDIHILVTLSRC